MSTHHQREGARSLGGDSEREAVLRVCDLERHLTGARWAFRGVSIEVRGGDRILLTGPSGAGKSLLLRAVAQLDPVDDGKISWRGSEVRRDAVPEYRRSVSYLHQSPALAEGSGEDNLRLPYGLAVHRGDVFDRGRAAELLARLGGGETLLDQSVAELSGGERQMLALVRLLQLDPVVLLLDEPTASLDADSARRALELVVDWVENGGGARAAMWVSHDVRLAEPFCNRRLRLEGGELTEQAGGCD